MKTSQGCMTIRTSVAAVRGALLMLAFTPMAHAADAEAPRPAVVEQTTPTSTVEVGIGDVSKGSYKFGEYNGLQRKGPFAIGGFDVRGGGRYDSDDASRWQLRATDLGLDTRSLSYEIGVQGTMRFNLGYDELRRNFSDSFQTPFLGAGTNNLTLPANWVKPVVPQSSPANLNYRSFSVDTGTANALNASAVPTAPTAAQLATLQSIRDADVPAFRNFNLYTKRTRYDGGISFALTPRWEFAASLRSETKQGTKPLASDSERFTDTSVVMPELIDTTTDQYNVSLNYTGEKAFVQAAYFGSTFTNKVTSMTWQDPSDPTQSATMGSAPSNQFHQFSLTGGYNFSPATKLVAGGSYSRNTQDDPYLTDSSMPLGVPVTSLHGLVMTKTLNLKLTTKPVKGLNLAAGYKHDDRDNRTPVNLYAFYDVNAPKAATPSPFNAALGLPAGTLGSNINIFNNRPLSKKVNKLNFDADYALAKGHSISGGYEYEQIERHCNGTWIACSNADKTKEDTLHADWRANFSDELSAYISYAHGRRTVNYDPNAWLAFVPMANVIPAGVGATTSAYGYLTQTGLTGFGPLANFPATPLTGDAAVFTPNNNIVTQSYYGSRDNVSEIPGMRRYNLADRSRDKLRSSLNWQASEQLYLQAGVEYDNDHYANSVFGLQRAKGWALNLDAGYALGDKLNANVFYTHEDQRSKSAHDSYGSNTNVAFIGQAGNTLVDGPCLPNPPTVQQRNITGKMDPCLLWFTDSRDKADTLGFTLAKKGLSAGKLDLTGDFVYTKARTDVNVAGGNYVNNPLAKAAPAPALPAGEPAIFFIPAANLPPVTTRTLTFRANGQYALNKASSVRLLYAVQRMRSADYAYDGMQFGTAATILPSNERAPNYTVHVIGISYVYRFQ